MDGANDVELKADLAVKMAAQGQEYDGEEDAVVQPEPKSMRADHDALQALQGGKPGRARESVATDPAKAKRDEYIMDTNNSSIVSKRSVEKLYYSNEPEYFRYFVSKFKRRSPLINRGYWLRMKAVEHTVTRFLAERTAKRKVVINLGCG
jgi:hypothetical protein